MLSFRKSVVVFGLILPGFIIPLSSCQWEQRSDAQVQSGGRARPESSPPVVEVAQLTESNLSGNERYTGTTEPERVVALRSRVEGQLITLNRDVGDRVRQGEVLAQLDTNILRTAVNEAQAELAARRFEVEQAKAQVTEAQAEVESAQAELQQAQLDADRYAQLSQQGALATQAADLAQTNVETARQAVKSAQEQVKTRQQAIASLEQRVQVQTAILAQVQERLDYATLTAPLTGTILSRIPETGDLIQPGDTIVEIGNLELIHIYIQVSDRDLSQFRLGQTVSVQVDAFPNERFAGTVTQISPVADAAARLVPVEVTIANPNLTLSSGLMARVSLQEATPTVFKIPEGALTLAQNSDQTLVFVTASNDSPTTVKAQPVEIGQRDNGQVEILSGLEQGQTFVVNSDRPLQDGQEVRRSFLSE